MLNRFHVARSLVAVSLLFFAIPSTQIIGSPSRCEDGTIEERLGCIEGLEFTEIAPTRAGYRSFELKLLQNEDHFSEATNKTFKQRLILHHKSFAAPMVLQTSGYKIFRIALAEITQLLSANQIQVEHRFFDTSIATDPDWTKLTIEQSAADFHRISEVFHTIYQGTWVNTGASKGGMTSVFHRRFYPNDVDATVAYVAPMSYSLADERYVSFVDQVGGDRYADCRNKLVNFQRALLQNKNAILPNIGDTYEIIGSKEIAFEFDVVEYPFTFWQYGNPNHISEGCDAIPEADASAKTLHKFLNLQASVEDTFSDSMLKVFQPYFYQVTNQLGTPASKLSHLADLMEFEAQYTMDPLLNGLEMPSYSNAAMIAVQEWVKTESKNMMFIYGEYDPWTAGAYEIAMDPAQQNYRFDVKGGNHGSILKALSPEEFADAKAILAKWLKVDLTAVKASQRIPTLEEMEFEVAVKQKRKL